MGIFSDLKELVFGKKKEDAVTKALNSIHPENFFQALADYGQSLGMSISEGSQDPGFTTNESNWVQHGIIFEMYGTCVAVALRSWMGEGNEPCIDFFTTTNQGGMKAPFTKPVLDKCKRKLELAVSTMKNYKQQYKLERIKEDF